jgi:hypothetical protein
LNGLQASKKDLAREVEILEEANRQQARTILHLRKKLASFNDQDQRIDLVQNAGDDASIKLSASSLVSILPSLSGPKSRRAASSSDDEFGLSTMLTECRPDSRKILMSSDRKNHIAIPNLVSKASRPSTTESVGVNSSSRTDRSPHSLRSSRSQRNGSGNRKPSAPPRESPAHVIWSQPHPEYEEVIRVCQTAKISETAAAIMQNKQDESGTRLLIRLLSGLHLDPQLCVK